VVSGSRYIEGITVVNWPIERILISYFGKRLRAARDRSADHRHHGRLPVHAPRPDRADRIERVRANGYGFQIELNHHCARAGARVKEIPFFFVDRRRGTSKLSWRIGFEALWVRCGCASRISWVAERLRILILNERDPRHPRAGGAETPRARGVRPGSPHAATR
jgi:hypothetical protein